ncbi:hypothetical protein KI688_009001 [Linnemannia hyalina]|uniref:C2H2-type domain-containing protein n=2 Tax=Linnemannia TaxID=2779861 RepID=A0A9P7XY73_9FUNG|nr:hypothetical protein KI688_009001 [Linnemannia hyalina]
MALYTDLINGNIPISYLDSIHFQPSDLFDTLDLQSLPSLMSPDPSLKDHHSESFDDDEDMDAYDIFATPGHGQLRLNPAQLAYQQQQQQHQQQQHCHLLQLQQQHQQQQQQQQQQQLHRQQYNNNSHQGQPIPTLQPAADADESKPKSPLQILRPNHPMVLQRTLSMPSLHQYFAADPLLQYQQQQQHPHQQQLQQASQPLPESFASPHDQQPLSSAPVFASSSSVSSSPSYHVPGASRFAPLSEALIDPFDNYLATFQSQRPILANTIPALDQDMDLMMLSSLILSPTTEQDDTSLYSATASNPIFSSPLSWESSSTSRENSPRLSPRNMSIQDSFPSSLPYTVTSPSSTAHQFSSSATSALTSASASSTTSTSTTTVPTTTASPKRRKRVRPPTVKKPKKIRPTSFPCAEPGCGKVFTRAYNLTSHMKTHSSERPFPCGACHLAFARRHDRERHIRLHTGEKPYSCSICGAGFMRNDALLRHQKLCSLAGSSFAPMMDHRQFLGGHDGDDEEDGAMGGEKGDNDDEVADYGH